MIIGELSRLCSAISSMSLFFEINITQIEASVTLFAFVVFISQLKNDIFYIEMDPYMLFHSSKGLEKTLTFKISLKLTFTSSSVIDTFIHKINLLLANM